ncbi:MBL fold metallo-hydrolase [Natrinema zhouii]|uniref:MBL fold metallo-hydrolase n=1 Tax=Natrinema zhouii TaxID=1710539 RepID=A0A7D6H0F3_9EURY|nr:MBL fold metallo-hydrolase [Natrinema zhouii]QLK26625.1 MBL fold metallo-hydrolase [Natrinema zhouii]
MNERNDPGAYALPLTLEYGDREITVTPTAVETDRGLILIDAGPAGAVGQLETHLMELGFELEDIWLVLLTHHDGDHVGGLAELLERVDATVATHRDEAPYVSGEREPIKGDGDRYPPVDVDIELVDGVRFPTLAGPMEVVATPGHAPGHLSIYFPTGNLLVAGDALVADGGEGTNGEGPLAGPKPHFTPDMDRAIESVGALAALEIDHTLCYHGGYVDQGTDRIREIHEQLQE